MKLSMFLLFFILAGSLSSSTQASDTLESQRASWACKQLGHNGNWDYENQFSEAFKKELSEVEFTKLSKEVVTSFGDCKSATPLLSDFVSHYYVFSFEKSKEAMVIFSLDKENKIARLGLQPVAHLSSIKSVQRKMISMRDGTKLDTWIFRPASLTSLPTVLLRTPYTVINGEIALGAEIVPSAAYFTSRGYAFIVQAIRGSGQSEGVYRIFSPQEIEDGEDAINWIAEQSFCDGNVAIQGTSYDGFTALAAGVNNPKNLKVIFSGGGPTELAHSGLCENKICYTSLLDYLNFNTSRGQSSVFDPGVKKILAAHIEEFDMTHFDQLLWNKTIDEWQSIARDYSDQNNIWTKRSITDRIKEIALPTYHIAGMNTDGNMPDVVLNFKSVDQSKNSPNHHLWLGPWDHGNSTPYTETNLASFVEERFDSLLAYYLKGQKSPYINEKRVMIQTSDEVLSYDQLPFYEMNKLTLFLGRTSDNIGTLSLLNQSSAKSASFLYLPRRINTFEDESQALFFEFIADKDLQILGPIDINLSVSTTSSTTLFAELYALDSTGSQKFASNCIGQIRVNEMISTIKNVHFEHCPVMQKLKKGDQLGILITSNFFPLVFRENESDGKVTIHFEQDHPSTLTIPTL